MAPADGAPARPTDEPQVHERRAAAALGAVQRRPDGAARQGARRRASLERRAARPTSCSRGSPRTKPCCSMSASCSPAAVTANRRITPAGEWLLDNFYLIEEQIRTAKRHLPKGYSRELPRLARGPSAGLPRVYDIALEAISHGDGRVDAESLSRFVAAYQTVTPLKLGRAVGDPDHAAPRADRESAPRRGSASRPSTVDRDRADAWADQMMEVAEQDPKSLILVDRRHGALEPADGELVRRGARAPAAGTERGARAAAHLDRAAPVRVGPHDRAAGAVGNAGAGGRPGLDQQQHRQPALPGRDGLARIRRDR